MATLVLNRANIRIIFLSANIFRYIFAKKVSVCAKKMSHFCSCPVFAKIENRAFVKHKIDMAKEKFLSPYQQILSPFHFRRTVFGFYHLEKCLFERCSVRGNSGRFCFICFGEFVRICLCLTDSSLSSIPLPLFFRYRGLL